MNNLLDHWIDGSRYATVIWYSTSSSTTSTYFYDLANKDDLEIVEFEDPECLKMFE